MHLDKQHPRPVYLQLKEVLQNQIEQGIYLSHQQLPSERDLCQHYNLSRMTARRALQELIAEGLAYTRAGKGTFVSHNPNPVGKKSDGISGQENASAPDKVNHVTQYEQDFTFPLESFDCVGAERAIRAALATHSLETVACELFLETIKTFEQRWQNGEVSLLAHNYAITTLHSHLIAMMNAATMPETGPKVVLACAPGDQHEIGLLLLALILRRRGLLVIYLGSNLATAEFQQIVSAAQPQLVCIAAGTEQSARNFIDLGRQYQDKLLADQDTTLRADDQARPILCFGGIAFNRNPGLVSAAPGLFLGKTIEGAATKIQEMVGRQHHAAA